MPTRYYGVFCPDGHFNVEGTYEVEHQTSPIGVERRVDHTEEFHCKKHGCGKTFLREQSDIAHSNWPDGREPHYPHR
jgi:hypothetical protein